MNAPDIRPIAICLFRNGNRILVSEGYDSVKRESFCRPVGGGIAFGESSRQAILREIREELGAAIENLQLAGVLENIFAYEGVGGHEIVFAYDAEFVDKTIYERDEIDGFRHETGARFKAVWKSVDELEKSRVKLVPEDLVKLLI